MIARLLNLIKKNLLKVSILTIKIIDLLRKWKISVYAIILCIEIEDKIMPESQTQTFKEPINHIKNDNESHEKSNQDDEDLKKTSNQK